MIISCPECAAKFLVDATALGATGRMVRCGKCAHIWAEAPPETVSENVSGPANQGAEPDSDPPFDQDSNDQDPDDRESTREFDPAPSSANRRGSRAGRRPGVPALRRKRKSIVARLTWVLLILLIAGVTGGGLVLQTKVIETWPASKRLYAMMGLTREPLGAGLDLVRVKFSRQGAKAGGLLVEGEVENISDHVLDVPGLRATLFDQDAAAIQHWPFTAPLPRLLPGENVKFRTIIKQPAKGAVRIEIDFHEAQPE